jgi:glycosyltransferase involved in cell wall biosynthesis
VRLAIVTADWPHPAHSVRAANVVIFELARALAQCPGLKIGVLKVGHDGEPEPGAEERAGATSLAATGIEVLDPVVLPPIARVGNALARLVAPQPEHFYPDVVHGPRIASALASWKADALLVPWSEWLTAACSSVPVLRFAYYGNPDPKTGRHRAEHDLRLGGSLLDYARLRIALHRLEKVHLGIMRRYHLLGDVAANDAAYYAQAGHPNAFYIRNLWIDRFGEDWRSRRDRLECRDPLPIIGNVGKLDGTANRYGLEYLGQKVLPALRRRLSVGSYRIEILGARTLHPKIKKYLEAPNVVFRGFVADVDEAMLRAPIFLCVNNATPFKVGHTRYLHAWTLGACVIAHRDARLSMPEIVDGENALLGGDAEEIADLIVRAAKDPMLCRRIGEGGWETYRTLFRGERVAADIAQRLQSAAALVRPREAAE